MSELSAFEQGVARYIGAENLRRLQAMKIGIAGAGGLGSNCAQLLVRSGFRRFLLVDFDRVEPSNLNRQFFFPPQVGMPKVEALRDNLLSINPDLELEVRVVRAAPATVCDMFLSCDAVVECFDDPEAKKMLVEVMLTLGKFVVAASGIAGCGDADAVATHRLGERFYVVGDMTTEACDETPPLAPRVALAAAKQADIVLEHFLNPATGGKPS